MNLINYPSDRMNAWLDDFFNTSLTGFVGSDSIATRPAINIREEEERFLLEVAAPGLKKEDFHVEVDGDKLVISAEVKESTEEKEGKYTRNEFRYGAFERRFDLPDSVDVDHIDAAYKEGILHISLAKKKEALPKAPLTIDIK